MTLNQLAWEMSENLGFTGIDPSVLSRVSNGERLFSKKQLIVFCKLLKISPHDQEILVRALDTQIHKKLEERYFINFENYIFTEAVERNLVMIKEANERGSTLLAKSWSLDTVGELKKSLKEAKNDLSKYTILRLLFEYLNQYSIAVLRSEMPTIAYKSVWWSLEDMLRIGKVLKNKKVVSFAYTKMGDVLNLVGGEIESKRIMESSSANFEKSYKFADPELKLYTLGEFALNEAFLKNENKFNKIVRELYKLISQQHDPSQACESYCLIIRGKASLGIFRGLESDLTNAWDMHYKIPLTGKNTNILKKSSVYRKVQLSRAEIEAAVAGYTFRSKENFRKMALEGLSTAKQYGYNRYFEKMKAAILGSNKPLGVDIPVYW